MQWTRWLRGVDEHIVSDGTVCCPRRGMIDLDECVGCESLIDIRETPAGVILECRPPHYVNGAPLVGPR